MRLISFGEITSKNPQLEAFPETHEIVHGIMRLGSKCKQEVSREAAEELLRELNRFVDIFGKPKTSKPKQ